jgi:hypothetical protein
MHSPKLLLKMRKNSSGKVLDKTKFFINFAAGLRKQTVCYVLGFRREALFL